VLHHLLAGKGDKRPEEDEIKESQTWFNFRRTISDDPVTHIRL
jgi:hypothetical protein